MLINSLEECRSSEQNTRISCSEYHTILTMQWLLIVLLPYWY